ncbi:IS701 family transposase [Allonocardiopsis opalescens]|uniref:SRSO17 transposase n=1 Tax=Allonocardiopsis opalescens TaxID=1144618 RepID=A0A2T0Q070_9ACTN|nr:IS701 family transposase [Allonocardiopsis opalescens]PRX97105.1 SRSO17 transposase [Allonocardiopsis opalescens]
MSIDIGVIPGHRSAVGTGQEELDLSTFCQDVFSSFPRSDQRRWGEVYVQGLVSVPGRKSIRRICEHVVGWRADQCLQQLVNQSPWEWEPVRTRLAELVSAAVEPRAWVVQEVVFPKNGDSSVGVAKQFAHSAGRLLNCQIGLAVFLADVDGSCPVNWRLLLPRCWDDDDRLRSRAHLPEHERHRSRWQQLLDAVDEMLGWDLSPAPIVVDAHQLPHVEQLLDGLEQRGLRYVVRVPENTPLGAVGGPTAREAVQEATRYGRMTLSRRPVMRSRGGSTRYIVMTQPASARYSGRQRWREERHLAAEIPAGRNQPRAIWLTNLQPAQLPELVGVIESGRRSTSDLSHLADNSGLRHFEGRSYRGWHHHVTLVSAAHAYTLLRRREEPTAAVLSRLHG